MSRTADISFNTDAVQPAEEFFVMLIGWHMTVFPEGGDPFNAELISIGASEEDGELQGIWRPVGEDGRFIADANPVTLNLYDELDRVEVY